MTLSQNDTCWPSTRAAALSALEDFIPRAGSVYTDTRNEDRGPADRVNVSRLSPWIRIRLIHETEVVARVRQEHGFAAAEKFIQEVCWRTYWKGWLQARPSVWDAYLIDVRRTRDEFASHPAYRRAIEGQTGIDCFDAFVRELTGTGYLHNHARMWFASIWIYTLRLPWSLGADFFMRHLLDGDAASNTLSWRWVGGLQTAGKHYVATAGNIRRFTAGRFRVDAPLAIDPPPLELSPVFPAPQSLPSHTDPWPDGRTGLLVTEDDLSAIQWLGETTPCDAIALALPRSAYLAAGIDDRVVAFRQRAVTSVYDNLPADKKSRAVILEGANDVATIVAWAVAARLSAVIMAEPPVGWWDDIRAQLKPRLAASGVQLIFRRHPWDEAFYPHATRGFFHLKKQIPAVLNRILRDG